MANENIKKIGCSVFAALLLSTCILMLVAAWRLPSLRAKRISNNLVDGGFFSSEDECLISRDPREYISAMFPIGEANIDYVTTACKVTKSLNEFNVQLAMTAEN
jgi:hypothetical protein